MNDITFKYGWYDVDNSECKYAKPFSKLSFNYGHTHSNIILKIQNINKKNVFKIFKDNVLIKTVNAIDNDELSIKLDIKNSSCLDIISDEFSDSKKSKHSFKLKKVFLDSKKIELKTIKIKNNKNSNVKTIVNSYTKDFSGGIGDFIRGSVYLYRYCKFNNIKFNMDFKHHEISNFIKNNNESELKYEKDSIFDITKACGFNPICMSDYFSKLLHVNQDENIILSSYYIDFLHPQKTKEKSLIDHMQNFSLTEDEINFFKNSFAFSDQIEKDYSKWTKKNSLNEYSVVHVRLGDSNFVKKVSKKSEYEKYCTFLSSDFEDVYNKILDIKNDSIYPVVVLSDSNEFKKYVRSKNNPKIVVTHTISSHCVHKPGIFEFTDLKLNDNDLKIYDSIFDIKILSESKQTKILSVYKWGSGFSAWISKIFGINCEIIQLETKVSEDSIEKNDIIPYAHGAWHYQLELEYNPSESVLIYLKKLINAFFISEQYKVFMHGNFPTFLDTKKVNYIKEIDRKIEESSDFLNLKPFCEHCRIKNRKQLFMNAISTYEKHFCEDISIYKKRSLFKHHIKPLIHNLNRFDDSKCLYYVITEHDIAHNVKNIFKSISQKLRNNIYNSIQIISENKEINDFIYKRFKNRVKYSLIIDKIEKIFFAKNICIFNKEYLEMIIAINENLKDLYTKQIYMKNINPKDFEIEFKGE